MCNLLCSAGGANFVLVHAKSHACFIYIYIFTIIDSFASRCMHTLHCVALHYIYIYKTHVNWTILYGVCVCICIHVFICVDVCPEAWRGQWWMDPRHCARVSVGDLSWRSRSVSQSMRWRRTSVPGRVKSHLAGTTRTPHKEKWATDGHGKMLVHTWIGTWSVIWHPHGHMSHVSHHLCQPPVFTLFCCWTEIDIHM